MRESTALSVNCPGCEAVNPLEARFCEECGAPLGAQPQRRLHSAASRRERAEAQRELRRARKGVAALQLGYAAGGVIALLFCVLFASWWYRLGTRGWGETLVRIAMVATIVCAVEGTLLLVGRALIGRAPFVLALVLASFATVGTASMFVQLEWATAPTVWKGVLIAHATYSLGLWLLVPATLKLKRLRAEHPELCQTRRRRADPIGTAAEQAGSRRR